MVGSHSALAPSPWLQRWSRDLPAATVLDVACGSGRHLRWLAALGHRVTGIDRDAAALATLADTGAELITADIEAGPWPLAGRRFDLVVMTNYLWRPLLPAIVEAVAEGGRLVVETFAVGNASVGKPSNPDFLLRPGELLDAARPSMRVIAFEDGFLTGPDRFVQRVCAVREPAASAGLPPPRYPL